MTQEEKDEHFRKFIQACKRKELKPTIVASKDGKFLMPNEEIKNKMGQRTGSKSNRTRRRGVHVLLEGLHGTDNRPLIQIIKKILGQMIVMQIKRISMMKILKI